jgi:hypothetical protein
MNKNTTPYQNNYKQVVQITDSLLVELWQNFFLIICFPVKLTISIQMKNCQKWRYTQINKQTNQIYMCIEKLNIER